MVNVVQFKMVFLMEKCGHFSHMLKCSLCKACSGSSGCDLSAPGLFFCFPEGSPQFQKLPWPSCHLECPRGGHGVQRHTGNVENRAKEKNSDLAYEEILPDSGCSGGEGQQGEE